MRRLLPLLAGAALLAGCSQDSDQAANTVANDTSKTASEVQHFCFFKPDEAKGWKAATDPQGNVTVTGKAHVSDSRYQASIGAPDIKGSSATVWLTLGPNSTGYGAPDDWWDVKVTIPNSSAIDNVTVRCDHKAVLAELKVPRKPSAP
jgi:nitrous oxide reductase accessory protein NosL